MFWTTVVVFVVVIVFVAAAALRGTRRAARSGAQTASIQLTTAVGTAAALTVLILFGLLIVTMWTGRRVSAFGASSAVTITVTGHQWWWEIEYDDAMPQPARDHRRTRSTFRSAGRSSSR